MSDPPNTTPETSSNQSTAQVVHAAIQFLRIVRHRKSVILAALVAASALGGLYYFTATPLYEAAAELLIVHVGSAPWETGGQSPNHDQARMPTYEQLFRSAVVLEGACQQLSQLPPACREDLLDVPRDDWAKQLREGLRVENVRRTNILKVSYRSKSPATAVAVVNEVVRAYLEFMEKHHRNVSVAIVAMLERERGDVEQKLSQKESDLLAAKGRFGDLGINQSSQVTHPLIERAVKLNGKLIEARHLRVELEAIRAAVEQAAKSGGDLRQYLLSLEPVLGKEYFLATMGMDPQTIQSIARLEEQTVTEEARLLSLQNHYGPRHPQVVESSQRLQSLRRHLAQLRSRADSRLGELSDDRLHAMLRELLDQRLLQSRHFERQLAAEYAQAEAEAVALNGQLAEIAMLQHDVQLLRNLHDVLIERIANLAIGQNQAEVRAAVVSEPQRCDRPVWPSLAKVMALSLIAGLGAGCLAVYVLDVLDDRFRSPDDMSLQLDAPLLAMIRSYAANHQTGPESLQTVVAPDAPESEAFRTLRTALTLAAADTRSLVVSSAEPGDGKTTVLANLGALSAMAGKRTLLIDCDMRRPGLTRLFNLRGAPGLSDLLRAGGIDSDALRSRIRPTGVEGLHLLPSGGRPLDPAELLSSAAFSQLVEWAEGQYDQLLFDSPPVLAANDAAIIGRLVDGLLLVVQPAKNHRRMVLRAAANLRTLGVRLLGIAANRVGGKGDHSYYGGDPAYGYSYGYGGDPEELEEEEENFPPPPPPQPQRTIPRPHAGFAGEQNAIRTCAPRRVPEGSSR